MTAAVALVAAGAIAGIAGAAGEALGEPRAAPRVTTPAEPRVTALGEARAISRSASASRDTPAMNLVIVPRDIRTAGGEFALATVRFERWTLRTGFAGLIELESDGETESFGNLFPRAGGAILWRGSYAYFAAFALDAAGARLCAGCKLELAASYRHESQHYTGSNHGGEGMDVSDQPYVGDDVIVDAAVSLQRGAWFGSGRAIAMVYLPGRSSYAAAGALDLHGRWLGWGRLQPFASAYAEYQLGTELAGRRFPDAYLVRGMTGIALASQLGDILVYLFGDVGHRKGVRGLTEEATLGVGIRLAIGRGD